MVDGYSITSSAVASNTSLVLASARTIFARSPVITHIASPAGPRYAGPLDAARWAISAATTIAPTNHRPGWVTTVVAHHRLIAAAVTATAFLGIGQIRH